MTTYCTRCGVMTGDLSGSGQCAECDALDQRPVVTYSRPGTGLPDISLCARCARSYDGALGAVQHGTHRGYCGGDDHDALTAAATLGRRGGQQHTQAQAAARRVNGARGGRPVTIGTIAVDGGRGTVRYAPGRGRVEVVRPDGTVDVPEEAQVSSLREARAAAEAWYGERSSRVRVWDWQPTR